MDSKDIINTEKEIEKLNIIKSENIFMNIKSFSRKYDKKSNIKNNKK